MSGRNGPEYAESWIVSKTVSSIFLPLAFLIPVLVSVVYERPIRRYLDLRYRQEPEAENLSGEARRKLLNEPFFLIVLEISIWFASALIYSILDLGRRSQPRGLHFFHEFVHRTDRMQGFR
jgi:hypothetical protein